MRPLFKVRAKNFLSLRDVTVELQPLNVLVGPNAGGKSNFLDVIEFLGDAVRQDLRPAIDKRGGIERVRFRGATSGRIEIGIEAAVTRYSSESARDSYSLKIGESRRGLVREEEFRFKRTAGRGRRIRIKGRRFALDDSETVSRRETLLEPESLGLSALPRLASDRGGDQVRKLAELFSKFRVFDVDVEAARQPSATSAGSGLLSDASNLAAFLHTLSTDKARFADLVDDARAMVPGLKNIHFRAIGGAEEAVAVELEEHALSGRTSLAEASYGSIRALALLAMLHDPNPPRLTCVEEIDHGLHPHVFDRLVERLRDASLRTQLLIVTHSPALVNRLHASELIVCERDSRTGETRMPAIDPEKVRAIEAKMKGKMGLGELWFSGTLGGVP